MTVTQLPTRFTIGGSDAAAAAGIDPHKSRVMLWLEKTGRYTRPETEAMRWGKLLEPTIVDVLEREYGYTIVSGPEPIGDPERPWLSGHPDGFVHNGDDPLLLEVKTVNQWAKREWNGEPPLAYVAQVQHYLHLTGLDRGLLTVLVGGQKLETFEIARNQSAIDKLLGREEDFYGYLVRDVRPPVDDSESCREALAIELAEHTAGRVKRADKTAMTHVRSLRARREQLAAVEDQKRGEENWLKAYMEDAETLIDLHDEPVIRWRTQTTTRTDVKQLKEKHPEIAAETVATTTFRRFDVL